MGGIAVPDMADAARIQIIASSKRAHPRSSLEKGTVSCPNGVPQGSVSRESFDAERKCI